MISWEYFHIATVAKVPSPLRPKNHSILRVNFMLFRIRPLIAKRIPLVMSKFEKNKFLERQNIFCIQLHFL